MNQLASAIRQKFDQIQLSLPNTAFILDDSHNPGEGEHKIMYHVKSNLPKAEDVIVIYGLDADLIFLALSLHHPSTYLIRENTFHEQVIDSIPNYLIVDIANLSLAIVNLITEAEPVATLDKTEMELETFVSSYESNHLINDYIAVNFFLGNDFVSRLFSLSIKNSGCEIILETYRRTLRKFGYLTNLQHDHPHRFSYNMPVLIEILKRLVKHETSWFENPDKYHPSAPKRDLSQVEQDIEAYAIVPKWRHYLPPDARNDRNYYNLLFGINIQINDILNEYLKSLIWTLNYYLGCCLDFDYYYPYNYAPLVSDLLDKLVSDPSVQIKFQESSSPIDSYHQLMIILPPSSFHLLPEIFHEFPLLQEFNEYFPETFDLQYYGHRFTHECPPKIPILDAQKTITHYQYLKRHLSPNEGTLNTDVH